ncbi:MAG: T9SS type A sorting domain-containing protein [Bacteroidota bacterium]
MRDASFFGLPDEAITKVFVTPTVGSTFHLDPIIAEDMSRLTIFSISGRLVETIDPKQRSWNATHLNEGIYFMVATTNSGKKGTQKIVVQKN